MIPLYTDKLKEFLKKVCPESTYETWDAFKISLFWSCPFITREEWIATLTQDSLAAVGMLRD